MQGFVCIGFDRILTVRYSATILFQDCSQKQKENNCWLSHLFGKAAGGYVLSHYWKS